MTQAELAEEAGLALETVSRIEQRHAKPTLMTLARLAGALEIQLPALLTAEPEGPAYQAGHRPDTSPEVRRLMDILPRLDRKAVHHLLELARLLEKNPGK